MKKIQINDYVTIYVRPGVEIKYGYLAQVLGYRPCLS